MATPTRMERLELVDDNRKHTRCIEDEVVTG